MSRGRSSGKERLQMKKRLARWHVVGGMYNTYYVERNGSSSEEDKSSTMGRWKLQGRFYVANSDIDSYAQQNVSSNTEN